MVRGRDGPHGEPPQLLCSLEIVEPGRLLIQQVPTGGPMKIPTRILFPLLLLLLLLLLPSCAQKMAYQDSYAYYDEAPPAPAAEVVEDSIRMSRKSKKSGRAFSRAESAREMLAPEEPEPEAKAEAPKAERMIHYSGWARLRVTRVDQGADAVAKIASEAGGHVERIGHDHVVVRVPAARFDAVFAQLLGLGEVMEKSISAQDVTEAFQSVELRLQTARTTRDRLVALLAQAEEDEEKLRLLKEIQRVSQQIDAMEAQIRTLSQLASFSRITIELVPREALAWSGAGEPTAEFAWIRALSPFDHDVVRQAKKLRLPVPEGMVALAPRGRFIAESADGSKI